MPSPSPRPRLIRQGPGEVDVLILLYHHIAENPSQNPYYVRPEQFEAQMALLWERGYRTISVAQLLMALENGAELPACSFILTFDDGDEDVYTQAYPILQRYGYTATLYLVVNYLDHPGFLSREQVQTLLAAGWEIGSHSLHHFDLTQVGDTVLKAEIDDSRTRLEALFGVPVLSFAYPYGKTSFHALRWVKKAGYQAGMGVGSFIHHRWEDRFYLGRRPIEAWHTWQDVATFLPRTTCREDLGEVTPAPRAAAPDRSPALSARQRPQPPGLTHPRLEGVSHH